MRSEQFPLGLCPRPRFNQVQRGLGCPQPQLLTAHYAPHTFGQAPGLVPGCSRGVPTSTPATDRIPPALLSSCAVHSVGVECSHQPRDECAQARGGHEKKQKREDAPGHGVLEAAEKSPQPEGRAASRLPRALGEARERPGEGVHPRVLGRQLRPARSFGRRCAAHGRSPSTNRRA